MNEQEMIEYYKTTVTRIQYYIYPNQDKVIMDAFEQNRRYTSDFTVEDFNKQVKWFEDNEIFQCVELSSDGHSEKRVYMPFDQVTAFVIADK